MVHPNPNKAELERKRQLAREAALQSTAKLPKSTATVEISPWMLFVIACIVPAAISALIWGLIYVVYIKDLIQ